MAEFSLDTEGFTAALEEIEDLIDAVDSDRSFLVGTGVEYAVYLEAGTADMDAKPFFQPVINEVRLEGVEGFIRHNTNTTVEAQETLDDVLRVLALAIERRVKEVITQKGLIDTGTLRASVIAIPGDDPSALPGEAAFDSFGDDVPATASRGVVSEAVTIDG